MERYENEGIKNPKILSELKDIKKITVLEKLLVTKNIFQKILLEFRKFHMEKFFDFCEEVERVAEIIAGKDIYFMMGTTGCGKSTTI
jgi:putative ribosome biogenesis GTPase RsgA